MQRLEQESKELQHAQERNNREWERLRKELLEDRERRRREKAEAAWREAEKAKSRKEEDEAAAKKRADEEAQKKAEYEKEKRQDKAERKAKKAAFEAMDEPEDSAQKAKKVEKHQKAAKKAQEARSEALEAEYAYRRLKYYPDGNAPATINRIPLFEEKPPGWVQIANEQMKALGRGTEEEEAAGEVQAARDQADDIWTGDDCSFSSFASSAINRCRHRPLVEAAGLLEPVLDKDLSAESCEGREEESLLLRQSGMPKEVWQRVKLLAALEQQVWEAWSSISWHMQAMVSGPALYPCWWSGTSNTGGGCG